MRTLKKSLFAFAIALAILGFSFTAQAQTGWGFQQYFIPAGSETSGYPIVTAVVPVGSYIPVWGSTYAQTDADPELDRVATLTYIVPLSPSPQPTETHLYTAGICTGLRAPDGYRKIKTFRNIYGLDHPELGFDQANEYCIIEIVPK